MHSIIFRFVYNFWLLVYNVVYALIYVALHRQIVIFIFTRISFDVQFARMFDLFVGLVSMHVSEP